jgi:hypothetical protein
MEAHLLNSQNRSDFHKIQSLRAVNISCRGTSGAFMMSSEESLNRKDVAGFLLGLGVGLVVGIVFKPHPEDPPPHLRVTKADKAELRNLRPLRDDALAKAVAAF